MIKPWWHRHLMCLSVCLSFTREVRCCLCLSCHTHVITLGVSHYWEYISRYFLCLIINSYIWTCPWSLDVFLPIWQRTTWKSQKTPGWSRSRARMDQMSCSYCISSSLRWLNMDFMTGSSSDDLWLQISFDGLNAENSVSMLLKQNVPLFKQTN